MSEEDLENQIKKGEIILRETEIKNVLIKTN